MKAKTRIHSGRTQQQPLRSIEKAANWRRRTVCAFYAWIDAPPLDKLGAGLFMELARLVIAFHGYRGSVFIGKRCPISE